ncbi:hypothetical protein TrRE_jg4879, partial [Triparma retinervis]
VAALFIVIIVLCFVGIMEGMQIAAFAVVKLDASEYRESHKIALFIVIFVLCFVGIMEGMQITAFAVVKLDVLDFNTKFTHDSLYSLIFYLLIFIICHSLMYFQFTGSSAHIIPAEWRALLSAVPRQIRWMIASPWGNGGIKEYLVALSLVSNDHSQTVDNAGAILSISPVVMGLMSQFFGVQQFFGVIFDTRIARLKVVYANHIVFIVIYVFVLAELPFLAASCWCRKREEGVLTLLVWRTEKELTLYNLSQEIKNYLRTWQAHFSSVLIRASHVTVIQANVPNYNGQWKAYSVAYCCKLRPGGRRSMYLFYCPVDWIDWHTCATLAQYLHNNPPPNSITGQRLSQIQQALNHSLDIGRMQGAWVIRRATGEFAEVVGQTHADVVFTCQTAAEEEPDNLIPFLREELRRMDTFQRRMETGVGRLKMVARIARVLGDNEDILTCDIRPALDLGSDGISARIDDILDAGIMVDNNIIDAILVTDVVQPTPQEMAAEFAPQEMAGEFGVDEDGEDLGDEEGEESGDED